MYEFSSLSFSIVVFVRAPSLFASFCASALMAAFFEHGDTKNNIPASTQRERSHQPHI